MDYVINPFTCGKCGAKLEAHTEPRGTRQGNFGKAGEFVAACPKCNTEHNETFSEKVIRVVKREH